MPVPVVGLYAALLAIVYLVLQMRVGMARGKTTISLGDGGDANLVVASRRHMNFVENVPLALLLMALVELNGGPKMLLHGLGIALLAARLVHPFGIDIAQATTWQRGAGAGLTMLAMLVAAGTLLWQYFG